MARKTDVFFFLQCILVRVETSPEDVGGMHASEGILTARGGMTSHAAVVARGWGKTCVSGCSDLVVDETNRWLSLGGVKLHEGDWVSLNGTTGEVIRGAAELAPAAISGDLGLFMSWYVLVVCFPNPTHRPFCRLSARNYDKDTWPERLTLCFLSSQGGRGTAVESPGKRGHAGGRESGSGKRRGRLRACSDGTHVLRVRRAFENREADDHGG